MNNLSIGQRLLADTPDFFKKAHLAGLVLILASAVLAYFKMPAEVTTIVGTIGGTISTISQFAVKDTTALEAQGFTLPNLVNLFSDVTAHLGEIKTSLSTIAAPPSIAEAVKSLSEAVNEQAAAGPPATDDAAPGLTVVKD